MKISAQVAVWLCAAFALVCLGFAYNGFTGLHADMDDATREATMGYAWFWTFLGTVAVVFGVLSWLIKEGKLGQVE